MGQLLTDALVIKNETATAANTATRVGGWMESAATTIESSTSSVYVIVDGKADLPTAVGGVITLAAGYTYLITNDIDLTGDRIVAAGVVNLFGTSSETSSLTSTGLTGGTPLITTEYTIVLRSITIKDVGTALSIDGNSRAIALDWRAVNFSGIANVGTINTCDNFIFETGAFLSAQGLVFTGTIGTVGITNSLFVSQASAGNVIEVNAGAVITRRFRIVYSSFVVLSGATGINVNASATIPVEDYILDTVNFSGAGTYLGGLTFTSDKAFFVNCRGITNTTAIADLYMIGNATPTTIAEVDVPYRVLGTVTLRSISQKFEAVVGNSSAKYISSVPRLMRVQISGSFTSTQNNIIGFYVGVKKGETIIPETDLIAESEDYVTASGTRPDDFFVQAIVELEQNDEVYLITENASATNAVTVQYMHSIIERTN